MKLKHLSLTLLLGAMALSTTVFGQWQHLGGAAFTAGEASYTTMAITAGDVPMIAFRDNSSAGQGKVSVMKYFGGSWSLVGPAGFSNNAVDDELSIAVDSATRTPYVAYIDSVDRITVRKWSGSAWVQVGDTGFTTNTQADNIRLLVSPDGTPYVLYRDGNASYKASVMKYTGGSWTQVGAPNFSSDNSGDLEFTMDHQGKLHVLSTLNSNTGIQVQTFNGNNWITEGSIGFDTISYATKGAITVGPDNKLYVALTSHNHPYTPHVWTYNGSSWVQMAQPAAQNYAYEVNLVISNQNVPILSYLHSDNSPYKTNVMYYAAGAWHDLGNEDFSTGDAEFTTLAVNSVGDVFVGYKDDGNGNAATVDVYLHNVGVHEVAGLNAFNLFPNPTTGKATITFKTEQATDVQLSVTNMMGQQVWADTRTASNGKESVDLSAVAKGLYTLQVKTTTGTETRLVEIK